VNDVIATRTRSWTVGAIGALALAVAGFAGQARASGDRWSSYERPATYESSTSTIQVPVRDGTNLGCDLYRPARNGAPVPGRFRGLVMDYWPYGRWPNARAEYFAQRGYAVLICGVRGSFDSGGAFSGWFQRIEIQDGYDVIEWMAAQPWSTGRIGQEGLSYGGITAVEVASARPPHLEAIAPQLVPASAYLEYFYPGGIKASANNYLVGHATQSHTGHTGADQIATWDAHPLLDDYWRDVNLNGKLSTIDVPVLAIGGWFDYMRQGPAAMHAALKRSWLVYGPYEHASVFDEGAAAQGNPLSLGVLLSWFDHWLTREPRAPLPPARVVSFEMPERDRPTWRTFADFPPPQARRVRWSLRSDRSLGDAAGPAGERSYDVDPDDGPAAICFPPIVPEFGLEPCDPRADQRNQDADRLTFTTRRLDQDLVVAGPSDLHLRAALSATDGNLVAKLMDVAPDGSVHEASVGYLKASHRTSHSHETPVTPGRMTDFRIEIEPIHWRFRTGHRLRVSLTSGDARRIAGDAPPGTVTVATGGGGSFVEIAVARTSPGG
jgi:predicted acyl esterase